MALILEQINVEGIAHLSYLIGDDKAGVAAVIDPRRDVDLYLQMARERGVRITHIIETHIHADFVSGSLELNARTNAPIYGGKTPDYQFDLHQLNPGDTIKIGSIHLQVLHTPGHTPEHICLLIFDQKQGQEPFGIFTGDTLFNLDVGRPDLLGAGRENELAKQLYHSLFDQLIPLGDRIEIYPCHGAGSSCGKSIGDRRQSTIGNEKCFNPALKSRTEPEFINWILSELPEPPSHYSRLKKINAQGANIKGCVPTLPPLSVSEFKAGIQDQNALILDTRSILAFGGGHIAGAINIALESAFPNWVGWMIDPEKTLFLIVESERDIKLVTEQLFRLGYDHLAGYLQGGITHWVNAGLPLEHIQQWTVHDLHEHRNDPNLTILDVRSDQEFEKGYIPGTQHLFVGHLLEHLSQFDPNGAIATYCGTGYRASIAASLLQQQGFQKVINIPGSWTAWKNAKLPIHEFRI